MVVGATVSGGRLRHEAWSGLCGVVSWGGVEAVEPAALVPKPRWTFVPQCATMATMSALLEKIRSDVSLLPIEEQQTLAVELFDAAWGAYEPAAEVDAAWDAEVAKRAEEIRTGKATVIPWATVQSEMAKEFGWDK